MFGVSDGGFVKCIDIGGAVGSRNVEVVPNGDLLVTAYLDHRVRVYSADGGTLLRSWDLQLEPEHNCQIMSSFTLAMSDCKLYVLDCISSRLHVFE